jgi:DNA repair protein RadC
VDQLDTADLLALVVARSRRSPGPAAAAGPDGAAAERPPCARPLDLPVLSRAEPAELVRECGLCLEEATRLAAAFALGRRLARFQRPPRAPLRSPERVARLFETELAGLGQESFHVLALDGRYALLGRFEVSRGTLTTSLVHPREVFRPAIARGAAALIAVHNHPSGDPEPSAEDLAVTRRLVDCGRLLGIPLLDHVVVGAGRFVSLQARMDFEARGPP